MLNLYRATPFQVKPSTPFSLISHEIPSQDGLHRRSKFSASAKSPGDRTRLAKDEESFGKQYLATQSSIYFRRFKAYPRSFLWKVVNDDKVLEIRCADLTRSEHDQKEAHLTLSFEFQDSIISGGVALSDADNADVLWIFVVTSNRELHTLSLPTEVFRNDKALTGDIRPWCRTVVPSSFTIDQPHRLYANTPFELFISFDSGRLQRFSKTAEGKDWIQIVYDDRTWTDSIRGMVSRRGIKTVQLGSRVLDPSTAQGIVASSDSTFVYTVCLNHTLRVWNLTTGKLVLSKDLLNKPRQPQDPAQLNPTEPAFIRLFQTGLMDHSVLVTFSPLDGGQFKFWDIRGGLTDPLSVEDKFPDVKLSPPDPDPSGNTIWSLTGFDIKPGNTQKPTELWVLWRNNNYYRLYTVHFDLQVLPESWETNWVQTAIDTQNKPSPPDLVKSDPCDSTEKWLEYLFWPGRYAAEVLETSLSIYHEAISNKLTSPQKGRSLQDRLCATISATVMLRKYAESNMDYERFASDTDSQWRNFWRIVETISEAQQAPLSLAIDTYTDLLWIPMANQCCAIRECNKLELLAYNHPERVGKVDTFTQGRWPHRRVSTDSGESFKGMCALIKTAAAFQAQFSPELCKDVRVALDEEMLQEAEVSVPSRIIAFYERCNFTDAVSNESYEELVEALEHIGGAAGLNNELFFALIDTLPEQARYPKSALRSTLFGSNVLVSGVQDILMLGRQLTLSLLVLIVFLECEFNQEERQMPEFDAPELFSRLLNLVKEYEKNIWLISHVRLAPLELLGTDAASDTARLGVSIAPDNSTVVSILYDTLGKDIRPQPAMDKPQSFLLTETLEEIVSHLGGSDDMSPEDGLVYIQCNLILHENIDLATDFLRFQPKTAWATYVKGRLHIARLEYDQAAACFRRAAYSLGK
jgi:nuclear pore complex protein Nup160